MKKVFLILGLTLLWLTAAVNAAPMFQPQATLTAKQEAILDLFEVLQVPNGNLGTYQALRLTSNLQVVNGTGSTQTMNGLGNLIVGYHEAPSINLRTGSHNLIMGEDHGYESYGGVIFGQHNTVRAPWSSILGGEDNEIDGGTSYPGAAVIVGGSDNYQGPNGHHAVISGGKNRWNLSPHHWLAGSWYVNG